MSRARDLSRFANNQAISIDSSLNVGINSTSPDAKLDVAGIVSATEFFGDGSNLTGVSSPGLGTALSDDTTSPLNSIYFTNANLSVASTITVNPPASASAAFTQYANIVLQNDADLIVADGDTFIPDILGIGTDVEEPGTLAGGAGKLRVDNITDKAGTGAPNFPNGVVFTGVTTATGGVQVATGATISGSTNTITALTNGSEKLRIDQTGKTTATSTHSNGAVNDAVRITTTGSYSSGNSSNSGPAISFGQFHETYPTWKTAQIAGIRKGNNWHGALAFYTNSGSSETDVSEKVRIDSAGRVLIGTDTAPVGTDAQYTRFAVRGNTINTNAAYLSLGNGKSTADTGNNDNLGIIVFNDDDSSDAGEYARIIGATDGANGTNDYPGKLIFLTTADGASSPTERLRISSEGVLSFKNTSPPAWSTDSGYANATFGGSGYLRTDTDTSGNFLSLGVNAYRGSSGWNYTTDGGWATQLQTSATNGSIAYSVSTNNGDAGQSITWSEKFRISSDGHVTKPSNAAFRAQGDTQYANQTSSFDPIYDNEIFDAGGNYNPTNGRFTAPVDGKYFFYFVFLTYPDNDPTYKTLGFTVNGSQSYNNGFTRRQSSSQNSNQVSTFLNLSANDYVIPHVQLPSGTFDFYMVTGHAHFFGYLVS